MALVSAIVCTRGRATQLPRAIRSLLDDANAELEVIVVDQNEGTESEEALSAERADPRLRYVRSARLGKGAALNEGLAVARGDIVVLTDDDCMVPRGWITDMARVLESQPDAVVAFCRVLPVEHDPTQGYVPTYYPKAPRTLRSVAEVLDGMGLGAGMALNRKFVVSMGGFDESFGPGGRFPSADEWDLCLRALLTGHHVFETPALTIVHDGFRSYTEGRMHARRDWLALGAVTAKPLRAGHWRAVMLPVMLFSQRALWPTIEDALHLRRPRGVGRIVAFVRGFTLGLLTPVDRQRLLFKNERRSANGSGK